MRRYRQSTKKALPQQEFTGPPPRQRSDRKGNRDTPRFSASAAHIIRARFASLFAQLSHNYHSPTRHPLTLPSHAEQCLPFAPLPSTLVPSLLRSALPQISLVHSSPHSRQPTNHLWRLHHRPRRQTKPNNHPPSTLSRNLTHQSALTLSLRARTLSPRLSATESRRYPLSNQRKSDAHSSCICEFNRMDVAQ